MRLKRPEGLNIIPFIDIMLVLLAIVLTVSTFVSQQSIKVSVHRAIEGIKKILDKNYEITIKENGEYFFQNKKISFEDLSIAISEFSNENEILLNADKRSDFELFIKVVDLLKKYEKEHINIVVKKD